MRELIREGVWLYNKTSLRPVYIIRADSDFWYEKKEADGLLEEDDKPELNEEGWLYYLCYKSHPNETPQWVDSIGHKSLEEAIAHAESKFPALISWNEPTNPQEET